MAGFAAALQSLAHFISPPLRPARLLAARRVRLFAAAFAGSLSSLLMLIAYYATLGLLPSAFAYPVTEYPVTVWAHRLDLAQFIGTLVYPPAPTPLTWWLGLATLFATYTAFGVVYAVLLTWSLQTSDAAKGLSFAAALFLGLALTLTIANGLHPAILRNALPDTGLLLLGWFPWATLQLLVVHLLYGAGLGAVYKRLTLQK